MHVEALWVYPVKSAAGIRVSEARVADRGFALDRRWMLVDEEGECLSQRTHPELVRITPSVGEDRLILERPADRECIHDPEPTTDRLVVPRVPTGGEAVEVEVWGDTVRALRVGDEVDDWLSRYLGRRCRLVYMPESADRRADETPVGESPVSFADSAPFLLTSRPSLRALEKRMAQSIAMVRFRPNIVIDGVEPFAEDHWERIEIGGIPFRAGELCTRCSVTTVDPETARTDEEPLATLAEFRRTDDGVAFGRYFHWCEKGTIEKGDEVSA